eukprot:TRINITY_DN586_c0_g1_i23.p1 TRINITY_DN586_c0_g1~~TRINITY_DN586_c0_g1_i23.p1  ORF type:complete len:196 (-),score=43.81 TRINITY_DN586_c0_g1_i23:24-611(-)
MKCFNFLCTKSKNASLCFVCDLCKEHHYCSSLCKLEDWNSGHSLVCEKRQLEKLRSVEESCPFMKPGQLLDDFEVEHNALKSEELHAKYEPARPVSRLGKGAYGEVKLVNDKSQNKLAAIKVISKKGITDKKTLRSFADEIDIHKRIVHQNIIRLFSHVEDSKNIYLVMEYATHGTLFQLPVSYTHLTLPTICSV